MAIQTTVPNSQNIDEQTFHWMDKVERRQIAAGQLEDLSDSASTADIIAKVNALLATQRTR